MATNWTLLEIVQDILSDMTSDEVNSIVDTAESMQVAQIVRNTYRAILSNRNWPHTRRTLKLTSYGGSSYPTHMVLPSNVKEVIAINYDKKKSGETKLVYRPVEWKEPETFLRYLNGRNNNNPDVDVIADPSGVSLLILNDKAPEYYTSFDDSNIVMDSYDSSVESNLQESKTQVLAYINLPDLELDDDAVPDLPQESFIALVEEAKSKAAFKIGQMADPKAEEESRRQQRWNSRKAWRTNGGIRFPNYGRKKSHYSGDPTFRDNN